MAEYILISDVELAMFNLMKRVSSKNFCPLRQWNSSKLKHFGYSHLTFCGGLIDQQQNLQSGVLYIT